MLVTVSYRSFRDVGVEGDRVVLVRDARVQMKFDWYPCLAEGEYIGNVFVPKDVKLADFDVGGR